MNGIDAGTEKAFRAFLARLASDLRVEWALLYGSRARGDCRADSDADLALVLPERGAIGNCCWAQVAWQGISR